MLGPGVCSVEIVCGGISKQDSQSGSPREIENRRTLGSSTPFPHRVFNVRFLVQKIGTKVPRRQQTQHIRKVTVQEFPGR